MSDDAPVIVNAEGRAYRHRGDSCPDCLAGKDRRINSAGFGDPVIVCGACGHWFEGETE